MSSGFPISRGHRVRKRARELRGPWAITSREKIEKKKQCRRARQTQPETVTSHTFQPCVKKRLYHSSSSTLSGLQILKQTRRVCFSVSNISMVSRLSEPTVTTAPLRVDGRTAVSSRRVGHCNRGGDGGVRCWSTRTATEILIWRKQRRGGE